MKVKTNIKKLGNFIREQRLSQGMTIADLSSKTAVSKGYISRIECGKDIPTPEMIEKIAKLLHADPDQFHILAGTLPGDVQKIIYKNPAETYVFLRETFATYNVDNTRIKSFDGQREIKQKAIEMRRSDNLYQLFKTDCFEWMGSQAENSFQAIVTDPPYGLKEYTPEEKDKLRNGNGGVWRIPPNFDGCKRSPLPRFTVLTGDDKLDLQEFFSKWAALAFNILVPGGHVFIATNPLVSHHVYIPMINAGFEKRGEIIRLVQTLRGGDRPKNAHREYENVTVMPRSCWEPWGLFRKPCEGRVQDNLRKWKTGGLKRISKDVPFCDVIKSAPTRSSERDIAPHPSLKPQAFMRQIVQSALPLGEGVVLDPFMGAGSTIAASCAVGYRSVGVELDDEFFKIAKKAIPALASVSIAFGDNGKIPQDVRHQALLEF